VFENPPIERSEKVEVPKTNDGKDGARIPDRQCQEQIPAVFPCSDDNPHHESVIRLCSST